ncbi:MAG: tetratricopeptide repeat protein [Anaerolineae bacterium]|nr:tetratricopeptide repeat protein [Anaerolineae bacterium]
MADQDRLYEEALSALENNQRARARDLLARLIKMDPSRAEYWLCMSGVVQTRKEQLYCLKEARRLDPKNELAVLGLSIYGETPEGTKPKARVRLERKDWQPAGLDAFQTPKTPSFFTWKTSLGILGILLILATVVIVGIGLLNRKPTFEPITLLITSGPSPTFLPTQTPPQSLVTASTGGAPPLIARLDATYTPTPLVVNTPHPASEDFRLAMRALERQDWEGMLTSLSFAATAQPDAADVDYFTGEAHRFNGDYTKAISAYERALSQDPGFAAAYLGKARTRMAQGSANYRTARADLEAALALDTSLHEAWLELARLDILQGDPEGALAALNHVEALAPGSTLLYYYRAQAKMMLEQPAEALQDAQAAMANDVTFLPAYRLAGETALASGELQAAQEPLELYLQHTSDDDEAMVWLADVYAKFNQVTQAMDLYDQALALNSRSYAAWYGRGRLNYSIDQFDAAESDLRKALVFASRSFEARLALGKTLFSLADYGNSYQELSLALAYAESLVDEAEVYFWRGQALEKLDQPASAQRDWQALLNLPNDDEQIPEAWRSFAQARLENATTTTVTSSTPTPAIP